MECKNIFKAGQVLFVKVVSHAFPKKFREETRSFIAEYGIAAETTSLSNMGGSIPGTTKCHEKNFCKSDTLAA